MSILFVDTEITGLIPRNGGRRSIDNMPHIVELAAVLSDEMGNVKASMNFLVRPTIDIPDEAIAIHGITNDEVDEYGVGPTVVLAGLTVLLRRADLIVAHNLWFDQAVIEAESARYLQYQPLADKIRQIGHFCTMQRATIPCALPPTPAMVQKNMKMYKSPTLTEAMRLICGQEYQETHRAMADCLACKFLYFELVRQGYGPGGT